MTHRAADTAEDISLEFEDEYRRLQQLKLHFEDVLAAIEEADASDQKLENRLRKACWELSGALSAIQEASYLMDEAHDFLIG